MSQGRIQRTPFLSKIRSADEAARLIDHGSTVGLSGFTGSGYPKAVPQALARRIDEAHRAGDPFRIRVWTGASTGPELDGALAQADGIAFRMPFNTDPVVRGKINRDEIAYADMHLSQVASMAWEGVLGPLDTAIIEVSGILPDGSLIPSTSIGNNKTWLDLARQVILEVNRWQSPDLLGMHDIYYGTALPPHRRPIMLSRPDDRIGEATLRCDPDKIVAIVETDAPDRNQSFAPPDSVAAAIAGHLIAFLRHEVARGRLPPSLLPIQSGVGNVANAVLSGLLDAPFENMTAFTEVIQDGMLDLLTAGKLRMASATGFSLSPEGAARLDANLPHLHDRMILRPQEISNHPELIRRLGCIAMNGLIEADIYGYVNSTHVMGSQMQNGIGGSGDFARNAYLSFFMTPSTAKNGKISAIVPKVSHVDHIAQDVQVLVTEQGLADLRGLSPVARARSIIDKCAHPDFRDDLHDYFERARRGSFAGYAPALLNEALSWHQRYIDTGTMRR